MFGDDSKLRLRRNHPDLHLVLPTTNAHAHANTNNNNTTNLLYRPSPASIPVGHIPGRRKRIRRREIWKHWIKMIFSGLAAALVSSTLSVSLLPFSWTQVDYHHQVQQAATHLLQRVVEQRHNYITSIRGKHSQHRVACSDGTVGFENDNYCDCPDGIDEPSTSACSHLHVQQPMFACKSDPSILLYLSRIKDGVRDCPDGSDEL
jgi:hypothetical protein